MEKYNLIKNKMKSISKISTKDDPKINFNFQMMFKSNIDMYIRKIKEIEGGRILFLYDKFFVISNLKTKKQICLIK